MDALANFWSTATPPQATIISGALTVIAAIAGVGLGAWLFSGRVSDLKSALDESDRLVAEHRSAIEREVQDIREQVSGLTTSTLVALGEVRATLSDIEEADAPPQPVTQGGGRERLQEDWNAIRDSLEQLAADPLIDGRTRARYARIDRRRYADLINALAGDHRLGGSAAEFREAVGIWQRYRNGGEPRARPTGSGCMSSGERWRRVRSDQR